MAKKKAADVLEPDDAPRKGARRMAEVEPSVLARLERGEIETATLAEMLSVDLGKLLQAAAPGVSKDVAVGVTNAGGILARMRAAGRALLEHKGARTFEAYRVHRSDLVRGWAAYALGQTPGLTIEKRLETIRPLADDANSGVREWAWIALRDHVAADLDRAIEVLVEWTDERSANLRRYASEITRPRGVWCAHIGELKARPSRGLVILEPLRADPTKYVQDSVSNWLNDASKSEADWVRTVCAGWLSGTPSPATERICRRALRSVGGGSKSVATRTPSRKGAARATFSAATTQGSERSTKRKAGRLSDRRSGR